MRKTWYYKEGSKKAELWTLLHLPYSLMLIAFVVIGFGIVKPINYSALILICAAYFIGIQASHFFDQLPSVKGSKYVKHLTEKELLTLGGVSIGVALSLGVVFIIGWHALWMIPLMIIQASFVILYPVATLLKGFFHTDFWFAVGFGFMPVVIGYYANTLTLSWIVIPFGLICFLIAAIEILLSRYVRKRRKEASNGFSAASSGSSDNEFIAKPEKALKLLCLLSYAIAAAIFLLP